MSEISPKYSLIFPLFDNKDNQLKGLFIIGFKPFGEFYTISEIRLLRDFVTFLELHTKYLKTYQQLQDFSQNLDKKVDEKTIEYNDLINKQKEFISMISHEIKSPIAGAILQVDSIMDDISDTQISRENVYEELEILNAQLVKVGDLLSKLFSVQYYDTRSVSLFKERIQIQNLLNMELDIYEKIHENVHFVRRIDSGMGFISIDKIQFQQVLTNLLNNALKFSQSDEPEIYIEAYVRDHQFHFAIEDNGKGFSDIDILTIFDKYTTGISGSAGLGIGLYLCKRIVEMHNGRISANNGTYFHGARIDIIIPV
ncbi:MAG: ATP-binding protein [Candidatus Gracilibacteria bacterium]|nr:ATP-binding protein [Candidatus Gracilibacteria bacterium]